MRKLYDVKGDLKLRNAELIWAKGATAITDIDVDLSRRDFTINAMALEITSATPTLVDPFGGAADLMTGVLRTPLSPEESFSDDPLRMLRAARFISQLDVTP